MKKFHPAFLSVLSGILLYAAWPVSPLTFFIFTGFIPLLWLEQQGLSRRSFFWWVYFAMFIWNVATTWWIMNSTVPGGILAMLANSALMCIPWIAFYNIKKRMGPAIGYSSFVLFWLTFEYLHLNWELTWPWLTLGNAFAVKPDWVQWYEYTGTSGGSLWVLLVNLLLFLILKKLTGEKKFNVRLTSLLIAIVLLPFMLSFYIGSQRFPFFKERTPNNIVVVQPNVDPYLKFDPAHANTQLQNLIRLSQSAIDSGTKLLIWPETAIPVAIDETQIVQHPFLQPVYAMLRQHPQVRLLTGIEGYRFFHESEKSKYSRRYPDSGLYFDSYNSAALFDSSTIQLYHKSKLVPGVETLPSFLRFLDKWFEKFGGTTGGYARQDERTVLVADNSNYKIAPSICYESIYGEFMSEYIRNGANIIVVITNDGWWSETPGFRQHMNYARLRAIETRKWVARSANTGISCFIDPQGKVYQPQPWDKAAVIKQSIPDNNTIRTFYTRSGDLISKIAVILTILLAVWNLFLITKRIVRREKKPVVSK
ncbi:MAG TPA: apolipoprotein N-acyltransferase [Chitinophagaceae bacterium]